ncbi:MAG: MurR/RpiR family transcriptional regulator [Bacillota bacterium]
MDDIFSRIANRRNDLTVSQRKIAALIARDYETVAFTTARELARRTGASESTVIRLARRLGYSGYPQFRGAVQSVIRSRLDTVRRLTNLSKNQDGDTTLIARVMDADAHSIENTSRNLNRRDFWRAAEELRAANRIYVLGGRATYGVAHVFALGLNWVLRNVILPSTGATHGLDAMMCVGPGDVVLAFSFPRYAAETVRMLAIASSRRATTIAITDGPMSPLAPNADIVLAADSGHLSFADSLCAPLSLANALLAALGTLDEEKTTTALREMEDFWKENDIYLQSEGGDEDGTREE